MQSFRYHVKKNSVKMKIIINDITNDFHCVNSTSRSRTLPPAACRHILAFGSNYGRFPPQEDNLCKQQPGKVAPHTNKDDKSSTPSRGERRQQQKKNIKSHQFSSNSLSLGGVYFPAQRVVGSLFLRESGNIFPIQIEQKYHNEFEFKLRFASPCIFSRKEIIIILRAQPVQGLALIKFSPQPCP